MTGPKKRGVANMIENPIRTYHSGCLYQIETLSKAITISLLNDGNDPSRDLMRHL